MFKDWVLSASQDAVMLTAADGTVYAVELSDPVGFTAYIGLAFVLYAIRETDYVPVKFMPIIAIILGIAYAGFFEYQAFDKASIIAGLRLGLMGVGSVATVKYFLNSRDYDNGNGKNGTTFKSKDQKAHTLEK